MEYYEEKIRRLEAKKKKRKRVISSDEEQPQESHQVQPIGTATEVNNTEATQATNEPEAVPDLQAPMVDIDTPAPPTDPDLDPELLQALGEPTSDSPDYSPRILDSQAKLWQPILKRGLPKEPKEDLLKKYLVPDNCRLLQAPKLNPEITAAISDGVRIRDKIFMCAQQQQLGVGVTAVDRAMDLLLLGEDKIEALRHLGNGCRLLTDLHYQFTKSRREPHPLQRNLTLAAARFCGEPSSGTVPRPKF